MTIRRIFWMWLIFFAAMVCYPHFAPGGFSYGIMAAGVWAVGAIVVGVAVALLGMERWDRLNSVITVLMLAACIWFALDRIPQENNISALKKIAYGNFPAGTDVKEGFKNFGLDWDKISGWVLGARGGAKRLNDLEGRLEQGLKESDR